MQALFEPRTVAVVGASRTPGKVGNLVVSNLLSAGYQGAILPVNPSGGEILGLTAVTDVSLLPEGVDLAVLCVPREQTPDCLEALGARGCRAAAVITSGFKEVGREGYHLEQRIAEICARHSMVLLGPNSLGLVNARGGLNATFAAGNPEPGGIAFFSQSGALCIAILDAAQGKGIGFSKFVSLGNKAAIDEIDMLRTLTRDPDTKVILGYVENIQDGQEFLRAARDATAVKPVIMIKSGSTPAGARAASSHTGAMAGAEDACQAAFVQSGVIRASGIEEMFHLALAFATQPLPTGPNLCVVTNSGGPGILAADAAERARITLAPLRGQTIEELRAILPPHAALYNPVDIIGDARADRFAQALRIAAADPLAHMVLALITPTPAMIAEEAAQAVADLARELGKPMAACFMGETKVAGAREILRRAGVPCYDYPEPAVEALAALFRHAEWKKRPLPVEVCYMSNKFMAQDVMAKARAKGYRELVEFQALDLLRAYGLPVPKTELARTSDEAARAAKAIGYPVALKIASPQISHKTDVGGVAVNIGDEENLRRAFLSITNRARRVKEAYVLGCLVQEMAPRGSREVFAGFKRDAQFGPLVLFGLGGVYVEVLRDVSCRLAPLSLSDVGEMVREIRSYPLLRGVRGEPPVDFRAIEDVLLTLSQIAVDFPEITECDFNPVMAHPGGALVVDARFTLAPALGNGG
nr:acetate--CoA ligase [Fundidesulfovibrio magnetotacticus]